jgi:protoporphyrinogen/coproporphyrinogen III oxidase
MYKSPIGLEERLRVVIIGGGITGLSAAYYLERAAQASGQPIDCTIIERDMRLGGKICTEHGDVAGQFVIEGGPDSFVAQKPWAAELARELGLAADIIGSQPIQPATSVLHHGRPYPLPEGTMLVVPTKFWPFLASPLISPLGKLRMALDLVTPARADWHDESLADFIRRRLGAEFLDQLAEPLMAGIHSAECERQSLLATFPRFRDIEAKHGSLIRGMVAARRAAAAQPKAATTPFVTLRNGVGSLVNALEERLSARVLRGQAVQTMIPAIDHGYRLRLEDGTHLYADAVIVTTPAYNAADLLAPLHPVLARELNTIRYVSTATITLGLREEQLQGTIPGYGVIIPRSEQRRINACTISSRKFAGRAPDGYALVRAFVGGSRTPAAMQLDDQQLIDLVKSEVAAILNIPSILNIHGQPLFAHVYRWDRGNPQYDVGHLERVAAIKALQPAGIWLAGAAYGGVGIPDCVRQGREVAQEVVRFGTSLTLSSFSSGRGLGEE